MQENSIEIPLFIHKEMSTAKAPWLWIEIESILPSLKRAFTLNHCSNGAFFFILNIFPLSIYVFPIHKIFYTLVSISMLFIYISLFVLYTIKIYIYICWYLTQHSTHTLDIFFCDAAVAFCSFFNAINSRNVFIIVLFAVSLPFHSYPSTVS